MEFFNSAIEVLQTLVVALGAGLGVWGAINLLEGYGNDNPGSNWVLVLACGVPSICWKVTVTTTPAPMLMYGNEASNRKQEIDRQHHTIPNQRKQRPKDKHCGNVHNRLWNHG